MCRVRRARKERHSNNVFKNKKMSKHSSKPANTALKDNNNNIVFEKELILNRWTEYIGELFNDDERDDMLPSANVPSKQLDGEPILISEIKKALNEMKNDKALEMTKLKKEMIEACEDFGVDKICEIANCIYNTGKIQSQMKQSIFITLPKKGDLLLCSNYRLINLMSHITKIILRVVMARVRNKINPEISEEQFGFRRGKGTRNAIFVIRMLGERAIEMQKDLYAVFVDYEKAFDKVKHKEIMNDLRAINIDGEDIRILENLYWSQLASISINGQLSDWTEIKRGVRQGCVFSPDLFSLLCRGYNGKYGNNNFSNIKWKEYYQHTICR